MKAFTTGGEDALADQRRVYRRTTQFSYMESGLALRDGGDSTSPCVPTGGSRLLYGKQYWGHGR